MSKKLFLLISIFLVNFLYSDISDNDSYQLAVTTSEPSAIIANAVNAITGDYFISETELFVQGAEPITVHPIYMSTHGRQKWSFLNHIKIEYSPTMQIAHIIEPNGAILAYDCTHVGKPKVIKNNNKESDENRKVFNETYYGPMDLMEHSYKSGLSNCSNSEISGRLNIKNNEASMNLNRSKITIKCANGTIRYYERYKIKNLVTMELYGMKNELNSFLFHLTKEVLPNQNQILYIYNDQNILTQIKTTNLKANKTYATVNIQTTDTQAILTSSDNKTVTYTGQYDGKFLLQKSSQHTEKPNETYEYTYDPDIRHCISQRKKPENRDFQIDYYTRGDHIVNGKKIHIGDIKDPKLMRVKSIKTRTGPNGELIENYKFIYHIEPDFHSGFTEVYDVNNVKTIYRYSNLRLDSIERYDENNNLKNKEILSWGKGQDATKDVTFLLAKTFLDSKKDVIFHKEFTYDNKGNIIKEIFYGNLSGKNQVYNFSPSLSFDANIKNAKASLEKFSIYRTFSNDNRNLLISETNDDNVKVEYTYLGKTDLIRSKMIKHNNNIKIRQFYEYNDDFILTKEIIDDGQNCDVNDLTATTQRLIKTITPITKGPFINMPKIIEEKYLDYDDMKEKLIKKTVLTYSNRGKIIKEEIYNAKNKKEYVINRKYDEHGRLIEETDPEGYKTTYDKYDNNYNLLRKKDPSGKITNYDYDFVNRLIKKEELPSNGRAHSTYFSYDLKSNVIATTDYLGNITNFKYDCFNNLTETIKPYTFSGQAIIQSKYDDMSREIESKNANGHITKTKYNSYNLPIEINYANDSTERFIYNLNGTLQEHIDQLNTLTRYEYDFLQRDIKKDIISTKDNAKISEEKTYNSFNLLSQKDAEGNITTYKYDYARRKISEKIQNQETQFLYDDLSRLSTTVLVDDENSLYNIEVKDNLNRTLEERKEDQNHNLFYKIKYEYDSQNNKTAIIKFIENKPCIEKFEYDSFNRLIKHEDANSNIDITQYIEENHCLQKKHTDPVGLQTIETFDALNRLIAQERLMNNILLSKEEFSYDLADNLISQKSTIINQENKAHRFVETKKEYNEMNKVIALIEAANSINQKETHYTYTKKGQLAQIIKPNNIVLTYEYDFLGNNIRLFSSNHSSVHPIDYHFTYNNLGFVIETKDNILGSTTKRELDHKGRILKETLANNLTIENAYDKKGNKVLQILPDKSFTLYQYNPYYLKEVIRKDSNGNKLYKHKFLKHDLDGNILKQNLINNSQMLQKFDKIGRKVEIETNLFTQTIDLFNPDGTIKQMSYSTIYGKDTSNYEYDSLKQLIKEQGFFTREYSYDSHNNRLKKDLTNYEINDLNQILKTPEGEIIYDNNGNPKIKHTSNDDIFYKYDALDRLVSIEKTNDYKLDFEYDAFNRRLSKKYTKFLQYWFSSGWEEIYNDTYLYDDQNEIAAIDNQNNFKELRILGNTPYAEIGAAIAFEINNNFYLPVHDIQGNVACVISSTNEVELYRYSAFGEEKIYFKKIEIPTSEINNNWRFASKRKDESNLIYFGRRYYDTDYGRWLTPDPEGFIDGINLYAFVDNDPLIKMDLYGQYANPYMFPNMFPKLNFDIQALNIPPHGGNISSLDTLFKANDVAERFDLKLPDLSKGRIFFENGVRTTKFEAQQYAKMLSNYAGNVNIHVNYNETRSAMYDFGRSFLELNFFNSKATSNLVQQWLDFFSKDKENCALQICHSEGAIITRNALMSISEEFRKRIMVVAIAPAAYVDEDTCHSIYHYVSKKDIIPFIDTKGLERNINTIKMLEPHPNTTFFDHNFDSLTYKDTIKYHLDLYKINTRGIK